MVCRPKSTRRAFVALALAALVCLAMQACSNPSDASGEESVLGRLWIDGCVRVATGPMSSRVSSVFIEVRLDGATGPLVQDLRIVALGADTLDFSESDGGYITGEVPDASPGYLTLEFSDGVDTCHSTLILAHPVTNIELQQGDTCWDLEEEWPIPDWGWWLTWDAPEPDHQGAEVRMDAFSVCGPDSAISRVDHEFSSNPASEYMVVGADEFDGIADLRAVLVSVAQIRHSTQHSVFAAYTVDVERCATAVWPVCQAQLSGRG